MTPLCNVCKDTGRTGVQRKPCPEKHCRPGQIAREQRDRKRMQPKPILKVPIRDERLEELFERATLSNDLDELRGVVAALIHHLKENVR